jgi:hypothetical protein
VHDRKNGGARQGSNNRAKRSPKAAIYQAPEDEFFENGYGAMGAISQQISTKIRAQFRKPRPKANSGRPDHRAEISNELAVH